MKAVAKVYLGFGTNIDIITFDDVKNEILNFEAPVIESFIEEYFPNLYEKYCNAETDEEVKNILHLIFNNQQNLEKYINYTHKKDEIFYVIIDILDYNKCDSDVDETYISEKSLKKIFKIIE